MDYNAKEIYKLIDVYIHIVIQPLESGLYRVRVVSTKNWVRIMIICYGIDIYRLYTLLYIYIDTRCWTSNG